MTPPAAARLCRPPAAVGRLQPVADGPLTRPKASSCLLLRRRYLHGSSGKLGLMLLARVSRVQHSTAHATNAHNMNYNCAYLCL